MLLPALSKAREKARDIACRNNMKQVALIQLQYADDAEGWITYEQYEDCWVNKFNRYYGSTPPATSMQAMLKCPSYAGQNSPQNWMTDYGLNVRFASYTQVVNNKGLVKLHDAKAPSSTMAGVESFSSDRIRGSRVVQATEDYSTKTNLFRHGNSLNLFFADGHVDNLKREEFLATTHPGIWENPYRNVLWEPTRSTTYKP